MRVLRECWEKNWPELQAAARGGLPPFVLAHRPPPLGDAIPVFYYHEVAAATLEADLRFLSSNGYVTVAADTLLDHLLRRRTAPLGAVVLSFDDGARNLYDVVYPLLRAYGHTAVAFVAPAFHRFADRHTTDPRRPCTWRELREMDATGVVDVQSHTLRHRYLPRWPEAVPLMGIAPAHQRLEGEPLSIEEDLGMARVELEVRLGKTVRHLAFPRFDGTPEAVRRGTEAGYRAFWTGVRPGTPWNRPGHDGTEVVRISGEFLRRLPGDGREPLHRILYRRYSAALRTERFAGLR